MPRSPAVSSRVQGGRVRASALFAALALAVVAVLLAAAVPARADDVTPPRVTAFILSPAQVDTTSGDQTVTATATITDEQSGVRVAEMYLRTSGQGVFRYFARVSGDANSGVYVATFTLPQGSASGTWHADLDLSDGVGNSQTLSAEALDAALGAGVAEITNTATFSDTSAPRVTSFDVSPHVVNSDLGGGKVTVTATIADDWAGTAMTIGALVPDNGDPAVWFALVRVSGDALSGTYSGTATIRRPGGTWSARLDLEDRLGNGVQVVAADLDAQFGAGSAEVTNVGILPGDVTPPQLTAFSVTPTEIDTEAGPQTLTVTATVTDDSAGVANIGFALIPLIGTQSKSIQLQRVSGDALSGTYAGTINMPQGAKEGMWTAQIALSDQASNGTALDADQIHALLPDAAGMLITNTATAEQVTIDRGWQLGTATSTVTFPEGTVVTRQGGGRFAFYGIAAQPFTIDESVPQTGLDGSPLATLQLGIPGLGLFFSQPVTISFQVGDAYDGYQLSIQSLAEGGDTWANETTCTVVGGRVYFTVSHATRFVASLTSPLAPKPALTKLSCTAGKRGVKVTLTGKNFGKRTSVTYVKFGSVKVGTYISWNATRIKCKVPAKAKFGRVKVTVVTAGGTSTVRTFTVRR